MMAPTACYIDILTQTVTESSFRGFTQLAEKVNMSNQEWLSELNFLKKNMSSKSFRRRMGNLLLEGPRSIHEANSIGTSYLEASTSLFWHCNSWSNFRSCRVYCDACGDDDTGYLNPLVRVASWNRKADLQTADSSWPNVRVELLELPLDCPDLQRQIERLQRQLDGATLVHFGLPVRRNFGDTKADSSGYLKIETQAGSQTISRGFWISEAQAFADALETIESVVRQTGVPTELERWVERYDQSPDQIATNSTWEWNYHPQ